MTDSFYFVRQPLAGNGSITVRVTSLTGLYSTHGVIAGAGGSPTAGMTPGVQPWSKAGIIVKASTRQGAAYAAMMVTGSHGVRMQWDFTHDVAGLAGKVSAASPRWLRLTRSGDTITGYDSADGAHWTRVGTATLAGLPSTAQAGLFAASPGYSVNSTSLGGGSSKGGPTLATGTFDQVSRQGAWPAGRWTGQDIQGTMDKALSVSAQGFTQAGGRLHRVRVRRHRPGHRQRRRDQAHPGGDIRRADRRGGDRRHVRHRGVPARDDQDHVHRQPAARPGPGGQGDRARPRSRSRPGSSRSRSRSRSASTCCTQNGNPIPPVTALTWLQVVAGTAALLAVSAVLGLAVGTLLRRSAGAVTAVIVGIVLPYLLAITPAILPVGVEQWLVRVTPAAAFAVQQSITHYPQVTQVYTPGTGTSRWRRGPGSRCCAPGPRLALALALFLLRRRDV